MSSPWITELAANEVFVFGSNNAGFHGAGAAGFAFSGSRANDWRSCPKKRLARQAHQALGNKPWPFAMPDPRVGNWAVWGVAEGHQKGLNGQGYAIRTVAKPGGPKLAIAEIERQILQLFDFAGANAGLAILMTDVGCGLARNSRMAMRVMMDHVIKVKGLPSNIFHARTVYE
jgi:hypothetical protein